MRDHNESDIQQTVAQAGSAQIAPAGSSSQSAEETSPLISAIVSTYNAERFIRGCLEDLEAQTIADQLEIIVVDSGSPQNEWAIGREFQQHYSNIIYLRTAKREGVYAAWNRGIKSARGKYVTNANTDDRHKRNAFECMAAVLEARPDIALVYANVYVTTTENETFEKHARMGVQRLPEFNLAKLIQRCFIGPQPMWRMGVHAKYGHFDESFEVAGDWEFWLRLAVTEKFLHLDEFLGLYLKSPKSAGHRSQQLTKLEARRIQQRYLYRLGDLNTERSDLSVANIDLINYAESPPALINGFNDLNVGQRLKVKGKLGKDGAFTALEIGVTAPADEAEIEGFIQNLDHEKNTLRLLNHEFALPEGVAIKDLRGLNVGDRVKLKGKHSALKEFAPEIIKKKDAMGLGIERLQGHIDKIDREKKALEMLGYTVIVNDDTLIF